MKSGGATESISRHFYTFASINPATTTPLDQSPASRFRGQTSRRADAADAAPVLDVQVFDGATEIGSTVTSTIGSSASQASAMLISAITFDVQGVPILPNPELSRFTLDAAAHTE